MSFYNSKKTIIAKSILGRLGNQMFQYAYCKAIKEAIGGSLAFSFDKVYRQKEIDGDTGGFEDSLRFLMLTTIPFLKEIFILDISTNYSILYIVHFII